MPKSIYQYREAVRFLDGLCKQVAMPNPFWVGDLEIAPQTNLISLHYGKLTKRKLVRTVSKDHQQRRKTRCFEVDENGMKRYCDLVGIDFNDVLEGRIKR